MGLIATPGHPFPSTVENTEYTENPELPERPFREFHVFRGRMNEAIAKPLFVFATESFGVWEIGRNLKKASKTPGLQAAKAIHVGLPL